MPSLESISTRSRFSALAITSSKKNSISRPFFHQHIGIGQCLHIGGASLKIVGADV